MLKRAEIPYSEEIAGKKLNVFFYEAFEHFMSFSYEAHPSKVKNRYHFILMANYYRHICKFLAVGSVSGSGVLLLYYNLVNNEKNKVYAARNWPQTHGHGIAVHKWDANWDRRNPVSMLEDKGIAENDKEYQSELEKLIPKATRHIFLIRHGQYNLDGDTDKERYLTPLGRKQAEYTGNRLKELNFPYKTLIKSTMLRAQETADVILECLEGIDFKEIKNCSLLEEGAPIPPEPPVGHWRPEAYQFYQDGPRIEAAFRKYIHRADARQTEDSYEIIICHSNVIRYFVCRALQFPPDAWLRFTLHHCSITWLVITPTGRVIIRGLGDSGHIPPEAVTSH